MDRPPQSPSGDDHLSVYLRSVADMTERFARIARENRLMAEEWQRLAARLRALSDQDEE